MDEQISNGSASGEQAQRPITDLAKAIYNLMLSWEQVFGQISTSIGMVAPNEADIKEAAEFSSKQFKDACLELNGEFMQIAMEWRLKHANEVHEENAVKLEAAKKKQLVIIEKVAERLRELSR